MALIRAKKLRKVADPDPYSTEELAKHIDPFLLNDLVRIQIDTLKEIQLTVVFWDISGFSTTAWCRSSDNIDKNVDAGPNTLKRTDVEWSQSRVLFVAPEFTKYQQYAIGLKNLGIQLWEVCKYTNGIVTFNQVQSAFSKESIATIIKRDPVAVK